MLTRSVGAIHSQPRLLMPGPWVEKKFGAERPDFEVLNALASASGVSLSAALVRLNNLCGWRLAMLSFRCDHGAWDIYHSCFVPSTARDALGIAGGTVATLNSAPPRGRPVEVDLPLRHGDGVVRLRARLSAGRTTRHALVEMREFDRLLS